MSAKLIAPTLHLVAAGAVNTYLLDDPAGLVLIDTGFPGKDGLILDAIRALGRTPQDLRHIVLTHAHYDHIGGLAALKVASGAQTWMHRLDAPIAERGGGFRPITPAPGLLRGLMFKLFVKSDRNVEPASIDHLVEDGDLLPIAGGLQVIHVPGHCAGQIALLWQGHGVLFAGDAAMNLFGLGPPIGYEDRAAGEASQRRLGRFTFEIACFGHGKPIRSAKIWRKRWR